MFSIGASNTNTLKDGEGFVPYVVSVALKIPVTLYLGLLVLGGLCGIWSVEFFDLSEPLAGLRIREDLVAQQADGWYMALQESGSFWAEESGSSSDVTQITQSSSHRCMTLLFMADDGVNMMTPRRLARVRQLEDRLLSFPKFETVCHKNPNTGFCYGWDSVLDKLNDPTSQETIDSDLRVLWANNKGSMKRFLTQEFDGNGTVTSRMTRSSMCFGLPLEGFKNRDQQHMKQKEMVEDWIDESGMYDWLSDMLEDTTDGVIFYFYQGYVEEALTKDILFQDTMKCVLAVGFILVVMIMHMRSLFLAFTALTQVLLSFPIAFFIYRVVFGIELFGGLQCISIFVVLGVGADDCFIYCDAFKQTLILTRVPGWDLEKRISFAYKRARFTMMVTTVTTGFAFLMLIISKIPTVRYFGVFSALLIGINFLLVITMYTAVLIIWDRYIRNIRFHWKKAAEQPQPSSLPSVSPRSLGSANPDSRDLDDHEDQDEDTENEEEEEEENEIEQEQEEEEIESIREVIEDDLEEDTKKSHKSTKSVRGYFYDIRDQFNERWDQVNTTYVIPFLSRFISYEDENADKPPLDIETVIERQSGRFSEADMKDIEQQLEQEYGFQKPTVVIPSQSTNVVDGWSPKSSATQMTSFTFATGVNGDDDDDDVDNHSTVTKTRKRALTRYGAFVTEQKRGRAVIGFFVVLCVIMTVLASQLKISSSENPFFADDNPIAIFRHNVPESFHDASADPVKSFHIMHGLKEPFIDRTGTSETVKEDLGVAVFNREGFDLADPLAQQHLFDECYKVFEVDYDLYLSGSGSDAAGCFMVAFALWRQARNETFPVQRSSVVEPSLIPGISYPIEAARSEDDFNDILYEFLNRVYFSWGQYQVGMERNRGTNNSRINVKYAFQTFSTTLHWEDPYLKRLDVDANWQRFMQEIQKEEPSTAQASFVTEWDYFVLMVTQNMFLINSFSSLGLSTLLTLFFLILATNNWRIAMLAGISICGIIITVLGVIVALGWELDTIISVSITILVGFSVDFTVHFAVSYDEAQREKGIHDRKERTDYVVSTMMASISAGAISTFGAACMLFPTTIVFFKQFGGFLSVAIAVALIFALTLFPALLGQFGPNGTDGRLLTCLESKRTVGLYDIGFHKSRDTKKVKYAMIFTLIMLPVLAFSIFASYGTYTESFLWTVEPEPEPPATSPWPPVPSDRLPAMEELKFDQWYRLFPGGQTTCARGKPYNFYFRRNPSPNATLIIEFEGGPICWNLKTCRAESNWIRDSTDALGSKLLKQQLQGIADPAGPYQDAHHLFIPMCTADYHWGNKTHDYSEPTVPDVFINHKGSINALETLKWVLKYIDVLDLDNILVTGSDSGAYGAIVYSNLVAGFLELAGLDGDIQMVQHGDGGLGLFEPSFLDTALENWGVNLTSRDIVIDLFGDQVTVPIWNLQPEGSQPFFDILLGRNFTDLASCLQNQPNGTNITLTDYVGFLFDLGVSQENVDEFEFCLNATATNGTSSSNPIGGTNITDIIAGNGSGGIGFFDLTVLTQLPPTLFGNITLPNNLTNTIDWIDWVQDTCANATAANNFTVTQQEICLQISTLNSTNITGFDPRDFLLDAENAIQVIPAMYLISSLRFPKQIYSQITSAFDYTATQHLAAQYTGAPLSGVRYSEQKLFNEVMNLLYDNYLPFMPDNYHHYVTKGDWHGHLKLDRHYSLIDNKLYQILYSFLHRIDVAGIPQNLDCRDDENCEKSVDTRSSIKYF